MRVSEIMTKQLVTVPREASISEAARLMRDANIGDVLVTEGGQLMGILTDRDIACRVDANGMDSTQAEVGDFMSTNLFTASPDWDVNDAANLMGEQQIRRLPIVDGGGLVGIVSLGDVAVDFPAAGGDVCSIGETLEQISEPAEPRMAGIRM